MYGVYSYVIGGILIFMYGIHICNVGPKEFLTDFSQRGVWIPAKEGVEEDCESRQLSLGGAIEAGK